MSANKLARAPAGWQACGVNCKHSVRSELTPSLGFWSTRTCPADGDRAESASEAQRRRWMGRSAIHPVPTFIPSRTRVRYGAKHKVAALQPAARGKRRE